MILAFFNGAMLGGAISGLPFDMQGFDLSELILSILLSMMVGMLLFMIIPMLTPLNATIMNVLLCLIGGVILSVGMGAVSQLILNKKDIL